MIRKSQQALQELNAEQIRLSQLQLQRNTLAQEHTACVRRLVNSTPSNPPTGGGTPYIPVDTKGNDVINANVDQEAVKAWEEIQKAPKDNDGIPIVDSQTVYEATKALHENPETYVYVVQKEADKAFIDSLVNSDSQYANELKGIVDDNTLQSGNIAEINKQIRDFNNSGEITKPGTGIVREITPVMYFTGQSSIRTIEAECNELKSRLDSLEIQIVQSRNKIGNLKSQYNYELSVEAWQQEVDKGNINLDHLDADHLSDGVMAITSVGLAPETTTDEAATAGWLTNENLMLIGAGILVLMGIVALIMKK